MNPQNGLWTGVLTGNGVALQITTTLSFDDNGKLEPGSQLSLQPISLEKFRLGNHNGTAWNGPTEGQASHGYYTPFGSVHLYFDLGDGLKASIAGQFEGPNHDNGVIYGTAQITRGNDSEAGTLTLTHVSERKGKFDSRCILFCL